MSDLSTVMLAFHAVGAAFWVGGMFFAYSVLRPCMGELEPPPERLKLWARVFERFFPVVWFIVVMLPSTGYWQVFMDFDGFDGAGIHVHWMHGLGWVMIVLFVYMYMKPYTAFREAVSAEDWPLAKASLDGIRKVVGVNLVLGVITIILGTTGRLWT